MQQIELNNARQQQNMRQQYESDYAAARQAGTAQATMDLMGKYPQIGNKLSGLLKHQTAEQRNSNKSIAVQISTALELGKTDFAIEMLQKQAEGLKGVDDYQSEQYTRYIDEINNDAKNANFISHMLLAQYLTPEERQEYLAKIEKRKRDQEQGGLESDILKGKLRQQGASLGLTKAQTTKALLGAEKMGADAQKAILELEAARSGKKELTSKDIFDFEKDLRGEYTDKTKNFHTLQGSYDNMVSSANRANQAKEGGLQGAADMALIFSFMKMLDPNSVVRETEYAAARDTGGLFHTLAALRKKPQTGAILSPEQRAEFVALSKEYLKAAQEYEKRIRVPIENTIKTYDLSADNIFPAPRDLASEPLSGGGQFTSKSGISYTVE